MQQRPQWYIVFSRAIILQRNGKRHSTAARRDLGVFVNQTFDQRSAIVACVLCAMSHHIAHWHIQNLVWCRCNKHWYLLRSRINNWWGVGQSLQWRHNGSDGVSNHQRHDSLLNRLFRHIPKKISKLRVTGLCEGNSPVTSENVSIWWRHPDSSIT